MTTPKDIHPIVMKVLDELSEKYFIHKRPTIKKSDNLRTRTGWEGRKENDDQLHVHYGTTGTVGD